MTSAAQRTILSRLQGTLDSCVADGVPGISIAVREPSGTVRHLQAGHADILSNTPADVNHAFGIGSITKVFVAVVILQLVEEQQLSLDSQVSSLLEPSDFLVNDPHAGAARIRDLLSHTSGIASWEDDPNWIRDGRGANIQPEKIWRKDETLAYVRPPASAALQKGKFGYANTNYTLLGLIIEHITSNTAESEIRRRILEPLEMDDTYFDSFEQAPEHLNPEVRRYHWATPTFVKSAGLSPQFSPVPDRENDDLIDVSGTNLSVSWTAGGMMSTPSDLVGFAAALRRSKDEGQQGLLTPASLATLMQWNPIDEKQDMGHGIFRLRRPRPSEGRVWIGHNGGVLGFSAALWWTVPNGERQDADDDDGCAVTILCNVGASHSGKMAITPSAAHDPVRTEILELAAKL